MQLFEGAKVSQKLIHEALSDADMTLGFEAEFYLVGIGQFLEKTVAKGVEQESDESDWMVKPLSRLTWHDLLRYFTPLKIAEGDTRDNQEIIKDRLRALYVKQNPNEESMQVKMSSMFSELRERYKPYHMITLMKVYPTTGFAVDDSTNQHIKRTVAKGNIALITSAYKNLDEQGFRMYERGEEELHFNAEEDLVAMETAYEFIADALSEYLGEPVVATVDPYSVKKVTNGYQTWAITLDESLVQGADGYDRVGVEVISPIKQAAEGKAALLKMMSAIANFGKVQKGLQADTTNRTGLHINIGVKGRDIDYVKLLFLMGDEYVAQNWFRLQYHDDGDEAQVYAAQTYYQMVKAFASKDRDITKLLSQLEQNISLDKADIEKVVELFRKNVPKDKNFSVNLSKLDQGFVEFRSPGNDGYQNETKLMEETINHLVVMMYIATQPQVYRQEFLKKLYKVAVSVGKNYLEQTQQDINYPRTMQRVGYQTDTSMVGKKPPQYEPPQEEEFMEAGPTAFFHVTPTSNLDSIMKQGLIPRVGERSAKVGEKPAIHLFHNWDEVEDAMMNWMGDEFEDEPLSLLKVTVPATAVEEDPFYPGSIYTSERPISPKQIEVVDTDL